METLAHRRLKQLAREFLKRAGSLAIADEVQGPIGRYRVDVAGYVDRPPIVPGRGRPPGRVPARVIIIECKQSRADFLRDRQSRDALLRHRTELHRIRVAIEEQQIKRWEPELRRSESALFPECEEWDFHASTLPSYHDVLRRLRAIDRQLHGETKFCLMHQYQLADSLYIAAPRGMIKAAELPIGWGLLECPSRVLTDADRFDEPPVLKERFPAKTLQARADWRQRWLRNIAVTACLQRGTASAPTPAHSSPAQT
ncbi:MAG: hypothetical protein AAF432_14910, partial [Planctomycetota bacterium]